MAGILRNLLTLLVALFKYGTADPRSRVAAWFLVTPLDTGIATLKSDKYFQIAESAQVDFMIKTALMGATLRKRYSFVNAAQTVKFMRPIGVFKRVQVESEILYADDKWVYFSHVFLRGNERCAQVLVKMKFKHGRITVPPAELLGSFSAAKPDQLQRWDEALAVVG